MNNTAPGQSGPGCNVSEGVLYIPLSSGSAASSSDVVWCHIQKGARGVMVIVAGYGHGDTSSNPGPD